MPAWPLWCSAAKAVAPSGKGIGGGGKFGKAFIANPDLVKRLRIGAALNAWNASTFYGPDEKGYTDYPALATA